MRNLWLVTEFTIKEMVKRKSFIISTIVLLVIIAAAFNIPNIMKMFSPINSLRVPSIFKSNGYGI